MSHTTRTQHDTAQHELAGYVRRQVGSAAIAAILMGVYAFGVLSAPTPDDLFSWCNWLLYYTLYAGSIAFGLLAVWSLTGQVHALAADGVLSAIVGLVFILTGVGMFLDGGGALNGILIPVFGWLFLSGGLRDLKLYTALRTRSRTPVPGAPPSAHFPPPSGGAFPNDRQTVAETPPGDPPSPAHTDEAPSTFVDAENVVETQPASDAGDPDAPEPQTEGGFLARFAKERQTPEP